ncbi:MAG: flagellar hook-basal body complex protein [Buchnera aphidicola (Floraphis choui)]
MEPLIHETMISTKNILDNQEILANNLANASTVGFKSALRSQIILSNNTDKEQYPHLLSKSYDQTQGPFISTMQPLDIAITNKSGWLVVQTNDKSIAYTRNGHLKINSDQQLTSQEHIIMGQNGPIVIPSDSKTRILSNGIIEVIHNDEDFSQELDKLKLVEININNLTYGNNGLYFLKTANQPDIKEIEDNPNVKLLSGTLEDSNVNLSENMINIMSDARKFDMQMKILTDYDENIQLINKFLNINN